MKGVTIRELFPFLALYLVCLLLLKRIDLVSNHRIKALDITNHFAILNSEIVPFKKFREIYESYPHFINMVLLITCWDFDSFYPNLSLKIRELLVEYQVLER